MNLFISWSYFSLKIHPEDFQCCISCVPKPQNTFISCLHLFLCSITVICTSNLPILFELPCTLPLIVFQGAPTKARGFLRALNSSLVLHSHYDLHRHRRGLSLLGAGLIRLNRIYLSSATNQHLKHVKQRPPTASL